MGHLHPNVRSHTLYEYGNRVGIFRLLDALDRHRLRATVAANAQACRRYPFLVAELQKRGYEFAAHGISAGGMITSRMGEAEERAHITTSAEAVTAATGQKPRGWIGQDYGESTVTPFQLAAAGLTYVADWGNDDRPYFMRTTPPLVSLPNQAEWDDVQMIWHRQVALADYRKAVQAAFNVLHDEGAASGAFFGLHLHPWLTGWPHRIGAVEAVLDSIVAKDGLWHATAGEIAEHYRNAVAE
jgi:peptidoglycan/xylan/chitin deacetylase (PgdA/CDA1 family)